MSYQSRYTIGQDVTKISNGPNRPAGFPGPRAKYYPQLVVGRTVVRFYWSTGVGGRKKSIWNKEVHFAPTRSTPGGSADLFSSICSFSSIIQLGYRYLARSGQSGSCGKISHVYVANLRRREASVLNCLHMNLVNTNRI